MVSVVLVSQVYADVELITKPEPGQEYVYVHASGNGAKPITRKDKSAEKERPFETAHKIPPSVTFKLNKDITEETKPIKKQIKRDANPGDPPAPAPAGAIKLDVSKLLEKYKTELKTTTTERTKSKRVKKDVVTQPTPILTTGASVAKVVDDDFTLDGAASEKQRSRIQIKKGPNGQEYEYEYVYYYYDEDEDSKDSKEKPHNSHDGPAREKTTARGDKAKSQTADANEIIPSNRSRGGSRGRQLDEDSEERLPANTRFPPRGRNIETTPSSEESTKSTRGRNRGRPSSESSAEDNYSEETQVIYFSSKFAHS